MGKTISREVANALASMAAYAFSVLYANATHEEPPADLTADFCEDLFLSYCETQGISEILDE